MANMKLSLFTQIDVLDLSVIHFRATRFRYHEDKYFLNYHWKVADELRDLYLIN